MVLQEVHHLVQVEEGDLDDHGQEPDGGDLSEVRSTIQGLMRSQKLDNAMCLQPNLNDVELYISSDTNEGVVS